MPWYQIVKILVLAAASRSLRRNALVENHTRKKLLRCANAVLM
jgi:hypothetical protein